MQDILSLYESYRYALRTVCSCTDASIIREIPFCKSAIGRDIPALQLGDGSHRLLYVGGITGSLYTTALLLRFARDYSECVKAGRRIAGIDLSYLHHTRTITVVPLLNPDGAILRLCGADAKNPLSGQLASYLSQKDAGKKADSASGKNAASEASDSPNASLPKNPFSGFVTNGRGVDLRCNCSEQFDLCVQNAGGIGRAGYPGNHPESEPECAAVCRYLRACASTDLALLLNDACDTDTPSDFSITYTAADYRTRSIAAILARDTEYRSDAVRKTASPGSIAAWYETLGAGPLIELNCPRADSYPFDWEESATAHALLCASADEETAVLHPGGALILAGLALRYGRIRRALFHGAVL